MRDRGALLGWVCRFLFALLALAGGAAMAGEVPHLGVAQPAGFDTLLQPQEAVADVVVGGRVLGQARVRYRSGRVTLLDVDAVVAMLPDVIDSAAVRAALASPELDSHFDTSIYILLASLIVYSKLKYISVLLVS